MDATVIDTLRFANRLKAAGVQEGQAEAMSRALNDEIAGGGATKDDLARAVVELKAEIGKVDAKFESLETQGRYVFLVLALIAALGLYNAVAPHVSGKDPASRNANATEPVAEARIQRPADVP